jgi:hypothetical protein
MAERVGFEPTVRLHVRWFSRPVLSTTQPSLQIFYTSKPIYYIIKEKNYNFYVFLNVNKNINVIIKYVYL